MLKRLQIHDIVLIEDAEIDFGIGFTIISGETGSGKSAMMGALELTAGKRADSTMVRHGALKGIVEASFDIQGIPNVLKILENAGIDHDCNDELIIRREISASGKSRAFINNQMAQLALIRQLGHHLMDIIGQHANQKLLSYDYHRDIVDLFGNLKEKVADFSKCWKHENTLREKLERLITSEAKRLREIEICQMEIEELQNAALKEDEEEHLFSEYTLLVNAEEVLESLAKITQTLSHGQENVLEPLHQHYTTLDKLSSIDTTLAEAAASYRNATLELQEVAHTLHHYQSQIEANPAKIETINERLGLITRLKRKYGASIHEIQLYQSETEAKLTLLQNRDAHIESLQSELQKVKEESNALAIKLTKARKETAEELKAALTKQIVSLNMPKAEFHIEISSQKRNDKGDDQIEFFLAPNVGERSIPIKESASGGELSRVMLAIQTLLAGKEQTATLIFDEIDANIGGETAGIVGEKLSLIGKEHQVLCITHFPQVAQYAQHHLQIAKQEQGKRTVTTVKVLEKKVRQKELARMAGVSLPP